MFILNIKSESIINFDQLTKSFSVIAHLLSILINSHCLIFKYEIYQYIYEYKFIPSILNDSNIKYKQNLNNTSSCSSSSGCFLSAYLCAPCCSDLLLCLNSLVNSGTIRFTCFEEYSSLPSLSPQPTQSP